MLETTQIAEIFDSLHEYECFVAEWTIVCAVLNPDGRNADRMGAAKTRARKLGIID